MLLISSVTLARIWYLNPFGRINHRKCQTHQVFLEELDVPYHRVPRPEKRRINREIRGEDENYMADYRVPAPMPHRPQLGSFLDVPNEFLSLVSSLLFGNGPKGAGAIWPRMNWDYFQASRAVPARSSRTSPSSLSPVLPVLPFFPFFPFFFPVDIPRERLSSNVQDVRGGPGPHRTRVG